jgi:hypothetical protein
MEASLTRSRLEVVLKGFMSLLLSHAREMLHAQKWLLRDELRWETGNDKIANFVWKLKSRNRTVSSLPRGLWFRIETWQKYPKVATFSLTCDVPKSRTHLVLYRMELNPFSSHANLGPGPSALSGTFIQAGVTHEHSYEFYDGMEDCEIQLGVTPMAQITNQPPINFDSALTYVCDKLRIENRGDIPPAPLQQELV